MNQQMYLLEARAVARDREHRVSPRSGASPRRRARHASARRLAVGSLRRQPAVLETGSRPAGVATARG